MSWMTRGSNSGTAIDFSLPQNIQTDSGDQPPTQWVPETMIEYIYSYFSPVCFHDVDRENYIYIFCNLWITNFKGL